MWQQILSLSADIVEDGSRSTCKQSNDADDRDAHDTMEAWETEPGNAPQLDDLQEENRELRRMTNALYNEIDGLKTNLTLSEGGLIFPELMKVRKELEQAFRTVSFLEEHNREQAESAGVMQLSLQKAEVELDNLRNEIVKIHPFKIQFLATKNLLDAKDVEIVNLKRDQREQKDKHEISEAARDALVLERQSQVFYINKLKLDIENLRRINIENNEIIYCLNKKQLEIEADIEEKNRNILDSEIVKDLINAKDQLAKENLSLKKKHKQRENKKANAKYSAICGYGEMDCGMPLLSHLHGHDSSAPIVHDGHPDIVLHHLNLYQDRDQDQVQGQSRGSNSQRQRKNATFPVKTGIKGVAISYEPVKSGNDGGDGDDRDPVYISSATHRGMVFSCFPDSH